jgi:hypothetical protein
MKKKLGIFLISLFLIATLAACGSDENTPAVSSNASASSAVITLSATNVSGAEAVPVAFDAYEQLMAFLTPSSADAKTGYDADMHMTMFMRMNMGGETLVSTSTTSGNMRMNIDGELMQSVSVMDTVMVMEMDGMHETMETSVEMYMEMDGANVTFLHVIMDGEVFDDPMMSEMLDSIPDMNIPDFGLNAVTNADISQIGSETHIRLDLDGNELSDFIDQMMGEMLGEMMLMFGMGMEMSIENLSMLIILDSNGGLTRMDMDMDMSMTMSLDMGFEVMDFVIHANTISSYTYNEIGSIHIVMPNR